MTHRIDFRRRNKETASLEAILGRNETVPSELVGLRVELAFEKAAANYELKPWRGRVVAADAPTSPTACSTPSVRPTDGASAWRAASS